MFKVYDVNLLAALGLVDYALLFFCWVAALTRTEGVALRRCGAKVVFEATPPIRL